MRQLQKGIVDRFWRKVDRQSADECWPWKGTITSWGYGQFHIKDSDRIAAHRLAYELLIGKFPDGKVADHLCRNRSCVNPYHLEPVTNKENILRGKSPPSINGQKDRCKRGHLLTPDNVFVFKQSYGIGLGRECRICKRNRNNEYKRRKKGSAAFPEIFKEPK